MASAISALTASTSAAGAGATATATNSAVPTQETFLKLLVAQLQNQDPMNPADSLQFVSQLAQFSELEQVMAIRGDIEGTAANAASAAAAAATTPATTS